MIIWILLAWSHRAGTITDKEAIKLARKSAECPKEAAVVFKRALRLREAIYDICNDVLSDTKPDRASLTILNDELRLARGNEELVATPDGFEWRFNGSEYELDSTLWYVARSAAEMLTKADLTRLRKCEGDDCGWLFEDTSRNRSRHWCDMQDCGNLAKVRRYRNRQKTDEE